MFEIDITEYFHAYTAYSGLLTAAKVSAVCDVCGIVRLLDLYASSVTAKSSSNGFFFTAGSQFAASETVDHDCIECICFYCLWHMAYEGSLPY